MSALSVVVLLLGGASQILDLTAAVITAMIIFVVHAELKNTAWLVYAATSLIALFLLGNIQIAIEYIIFAAYPILKPIFEKAGKLFGNIIKYIFMALSSISLTLLFRYVFLLGNVWYWDVAFCVGLFVCYILFDIALGRFKIYYFYKLRAQLKLNRFFD